MSHLKHLTPEQRLEHTREQRRQQRVRHQARMTPEKKAERAEYMRRWHEARKAGQLFGRSKLPADEIRRRKCERERIRRQRLRGGRPAAVPMSLEERKARRREYNRAYYHAHKPPAAKKPPRIANTKTIVPAKVKPHGLVDCAKAHPAVAIVPAETVEQWQARTGKQPEVLPPAGLYQMPELMPVGVWWRGVRAAA